MESVFTITISIAVPTGASLSTSTRQVDKVEATPVVQQVEQTSEVETKAEAPFQEAVQTAVSEQPVKRGRKVVSEKAEVGVLQQVEAAPAEPEMDLGEVSTPDPLAVKRAALQRDNGILVQRIEQKATILEIADTFDLSTYSDWGTFENLSSICKSIVETHRPLLSSLFKGYEIGGALSNLPKTKWSSFISSLCLAVRLGLPEVEFKDGKPQLL